MRFYKKWSLWSQSFSVRAIYAYDERTISSRALWSKIQDPLHLGRAQKVWQKILILKSVFDQSRFMRFSGA